MSDYIRNARAVLAEWSIERLSKVATWGELLFDIRDKFASGCETHIAWRFQVAVILDFLCGFRPMPNEDVWLEAESALSEGVSRWGFRYFDSDFLPPDIDTASAILRALGSSNQYVVDNYNQIKKVYEDEWPLIPTWLDETPRTISSQNGGGRYHSDVLLGLLTTERMLGKNIQYKDIAQVIKACGLSPFWYLQEGHSLYLLSQLVASPSSLESDCAIEVNSAAQKLFEPQFVFHSAANHTALRLLIIRERSGVLSFAYRAAVIEWLGGDSSPWWKMTLIALSFMNREMVPYWTVGFRPFCSRIVSTALIGKVAIGATSTGYHIFQDANK